MISPKVIAVSRSPLHTFSKNVCESIELIAGVGVKDDAHAGTLVKHRSRVARDPTQPNLRQVHLLHVELFDELSGKGFSVRPGQMGENITTIGIDLLRLPKNTILQIGDSAEVQITGLRNPCSQLESIQTGLMQAVLGLSENGEVIRKAGIMSIVLKSGEIKPGDSIRVKTPESFEELKPV